MKNSVPLVITKARSFRPWPESQQLFLFAEAQRFNVSELLNEIVVKHLRRHIQTKVLAQQRAVTALAPARSTKPKPRR